MKKTTISDLKNRLSHYLRYVRTGQSVLIYDRDRPIARIDPLRGPAENDHEEWTAELERSGALRPPGVRLGPDWIRDRVSARGDLVTALLDERGSGR